MVTSFVTSSNSLLLDQARLDVGLDVLLGQALLLQLLLVRLQVTREVLVDQPVEVLLDRGRRHCDAERGRLLLQHEALDEVVDVRALQLLVLGRPRLRELAALRFVCPLRLLQEAFERRSRDGRSVDDRDGVGRHLRRARIGGLGRRPAPTAARGECEGRRRNEHRQSEETGGKHRERRGNSRPRAGFPG